MIEGFAKVVAIDGAIAWLEPESPPACGGCAAKAGCGTAYVGSAAGARRFSVANDFGGRVGERLVVGIDKTVLTRASALAYVVPVVALVMGAVIASLLGAGDGGTALGAVAGLGIGAAVARLRARIMAAGGELTPVVLRRLSPEETCSSGRADA